MATIFPVYAGQQFGTWGELAWNDCVLAFDLDEMCRTEERPTFQTMKDRGGLFPDQVVVCLNEPEASEHGTTPGYFVSPLNGMAAKGRLDEAQGKGGIDAAT